MCQQCILFAILYIFRLNLFVCWGFCLVFLFVWVFLFVQLLLMTLQIPVNLFISDRTVTKERFILEMVLQTLGSSLKLKHFSNFIFLRMRHWRRFLSSVRSLLICIDIIFYLLTAYSFKEYSRALFSLNLIYHYILSYQKIHQKDVLIPSAATLGGFSPKSH